MRKSPQDIQSRLGLPLTSALMLLATVVSFIVALWVVIVLARLVMG
ncbi:MAG: hypothetical protein IKL97_04620 [Eggerthellaceae bacterium]|nr:hypothetical protein [Eggerthellaceae bacterium]